MGHYFFITPKSIVFQPLALYGDPYQILFSLFDLGKQLFNALMRDNPGLKLGDEYVYLVKQSYALEGDEFAAACHKLGEKVSNARFKIDLSTGPELEFIHNKLAADDAAQYSQFTERWVGAIIDNKIDPEQLTKESRKRADELVLGLAKNVEALALYSKDMGQSFQDITGHLTQGSLAQAQLLVVALKEMNRLVDGLNSYNSRLGLKKASIPDPVPLNLSTLSNSYARKKSVKDMSDAELCAYWKEIREEDGSH